MLFCQQYNNTVCIVCMLCITMRKRYADVYVQRYSTITLLFRVNWEWIRRVPYTRTGWWNSHGRFEYSLFAGLEHYKIRDTYFSGRSLKIFRFLRGDFLFGITFTFHEEYTPPLVLQNNSVVFPFLYKLRILHLVYLYHITNNRIIGRITCFCLLYFGFCLYF